MSDCLQLVARPSETPISRARFRRESPVSRNATRPSRELAMFWRRRRRQSRLSSFWLMRMKLLRNVFVDFFASAAAADNVVDGVRERGSYLSKKAMAHLLHQQQQQQQHN